MLVDFFIFIKYSVPMEDYLLEFSNVSTFSNTTENVHNLSFSVRAGENVVFFGPEDSGVSFIFSLILDIELEFDGNIYYKLITDIISWGNVYEFVKISNAGTDLEYVWDFIEFHSEINPDDPGYRHEPWSVKSPCRCDPDARSETYFTAPGPGLGY